jgi:hypothetical protein
MGEKLIRVIALLTAVERLLLSQRQIFLPQLLFVAFKKMDYISPSNASSRSIEISDFFDPMLGRLRVHRLWMLLLRLGRPQHRCQDWQTTIILLGCYLPYA